MFDLATASVFVIGFMCLLEFAGAYFGKLKIPNILRALIEVALIIFAVWWYLYFLK